MTLFDTAMAGTEQDSGRGPRGILTYVIRDKGVWRFKHYTAVIYAWKCQPVGKKTADLPRVDEPGEAIAIDK